MAVRKALGRSAAPRSPPTRGRELPLALPLLDDLKIEAKAALRAVAVALRVGPLWKVGTLTGSAVCSLGFCQTPASTRATVFFNSTAAVRSFHPRRSRRHSPCARGA